MANRKQISHFDHYKRLGHLAVAVTEYYMADHVSVVERANISILSQRFENFFDSNNSNSLYPPLLRIQTLSLTGEDYGQHSKKPGQQYPPSRDQGRRMQWMTCWCIRSRTLDYRDWRWTAWKAKRRRNRSLRIFGNPAF
jgi:hypothetical protein